MPMVTKLGGVAAVYALLAADLEPDEFHEGLMRRCELGRLNLAAGAGTGSCEHQR